MENRPFLLDVVLYLRDQRGLPWENARILTGTRNMFMLHCNPPLTAVHDCYIVTAFDIKGLRTKIAIRLFADFICLRVCQSSILIMYLKVNDELTLTLKPRGVWHCAVRPGSGSSCQWSAVSQDGTYKWLHQILALSVISL